jgi:hypothetical protein
MVTAAVNATWLPPFKHWRQNTTWQQSSTFIREDTRCTSSCALRLNEQAKMVR